MSNPRVCVYMCACMYTFSILSAELSKIISHVFEDRWLNSQGIDQVCMHKNYSVTV